MSTGQPEGITDVRLNWEYRCKILATEDGWPKKDSLVRFCERRGQRLTQADRMRAALGEDRPLPLWVGRAVVDYLNHRERWSDSYETVLDPYFPDEHWGPGWRGVLDHIIEQFRPASETRLARGGASDYSRVACTVAANVGRLSAKIGDQLDHASCIQRGEQLMQRTTIQYAEWLQRMHAWNRRTVMYSCAAGGRRTGVSVVLPLKERTAEMMAAGELSDAEITTDHLQSPSRYVFLNAVFPFAGISQSEDLQRSEVNCVMYQAAHFTRRLRPYRPVIITFASTRFIRDRLVRLGYRETGATLKGFGLPMMTLRPRGEMPPCEPTPSCLPYELMCLGLKMYGLVNAGRWRREDRDAGATPV